MRTSKTTSLAALPPKGVPSWFGEDRGTLQSFFQQKGGVFSTSTEWCAVNSNQCRISSCRYDHSTSNNAPSSWLNDLHSNNNIWRYIWRWMFLHRQQARCFTAAKRTGDHDVRCGDAQPWCWSGPRQGKIRHQAEERSPVPCSTHSRCAGDEHHLHRSSKSVQRSAQATQPVSLPKLDSGVSQKSGEWLWTCFTVCVTTYCLPRCTAQMSPSDPGSKRVVSN